MKNSMLQKRIKQRESDRNILLSEIQLHEMKQDKSVDYDMHNISYVSF